MNKEIQNNMVSVIIPVYNIEPKYFYDCVESVLGQSYRNIELIIVDDGSDNDIFSLIEPYKSDKRIKCFRRENLGVSAARNYGLEKASGEFILFLDSDDWIEQNTIEFAVKKIIETEADAVCWNHYYNQNNKQYKRHEIEGDLKVYDKNNIKRLLLCFITPEYESRYNGIHLGAVRGVWSKLYRHSIIKENTIRFNTRLRIGEDACFNIQYFRNAQHVRFYNEYLNHYRIVNTSANRRTRSDLCTLRLALLEEYLDIFSSDKNTDFYTCYCREVLSCVLNCLKRDICADSKGIKTKMKIDRIKSLINEKSIRLAFDYSVDKDFFSAPEKLLIAIIRRKKYWILYFIGTVLYLLDK